jgi:hypothetical protein
MQVYLIQNKTDIFPAILLRRLTTVHWSFLTLLDIFVDNLKELSLLHAQMQLLRIYAAIGTFSSK